MSEVIRFASHHRKTGSLGRRIAETPLVPEAPRIPASLGNCVANLPQKLFANAPSGYSQAAGISRHFQCAVQLKMGKSAYVVQIQRIGVARVVDVRDVIA